MNNDEKIREYLDSEPVPEELSPENIKEMLDEKSAKKKRKGISVAGRLAATAAALAVVVGGYLGTVGLLGGHNKNLDMAVSETPQSEKAPLNRDESPEMSESKPISAPYMKGADSYEAVYKLMKKASENNDNYYFSNSFDGIGDIKGEVDADQPSGDLSGWNGDSEEEHTEYSDTYNQEEGVLEADIVKTDGKRIYTLCNRYNEPRYTDDGQIIIDAGYAMEWNTPLLRSASVDKGKFSAPSEIAVRQKMDLGDDWEHNITINEMYLYNDMIAVITSDDAYNEGKKDGYWRYDGKFCTFVSFYTLDDEPQLIGSYSQDGYFKDVRISPEGYLYLITTYDSVNFEYVEDADDISAYIPKCGVNDKAQCLMPEDILLPNKLDSDGCMSYTIIGSLDLTVSEKFIVSDKKALAGYTGGLYSSADNLYTTVGWNDTEITRISISGGKIEPAAGGKIEGYIHDQFSMSEYDGYFRVAATVENWGGNGNESWVDRIFGTSDDFVRPERHSCVYVLDMDMNIVGKTEDFGKDESIKSVNFNKDRCYVVTYRQTDPLFAIDLSDPKNPVITDEYKINGYSTYMQKWSDDLLLGVGYDGDDDGRTTGLKLVMFDNSDPNDLKEVGYIGLHSPDDGSISSEATYDRKAIFVAPEKNLIGIPVTRMIWDANNSLSHDVMFDFFSYEDGKFTIRGELGDKRYNESYNWSDNTTYRRALYIGNYVYVVSGGSMISADLETLREYDRINFE